MNVCVIPARGGSKRIPRKNIKDFCGKPMIAWSIKAALASNCFDQVIVSTDDAEIAQVAKQYGANVPFIRPQNLSDDYIGTTPVVVHAIDFLEQEGKNIEHVCCIYATAPFIEAIDIQKGMLSLKESGKKFSIGITTYPFPPQRAITLTNNSCINPIWPDKMMSRSQDLEEAYHDAGQLYCGTLDAWKSAESLFEQTSIGFILPRWKVQDIDTNEDWQYAEVMYETLQTMRAKNNY